jgi:hypothetical protein
VETGFPSANERENAFARRSCSNKERLDQPASAEIRLNLSLPGLTRQPIIFLKSLLQGLMDARVEARA